MKPHLASKLLILSLVLSPLSLDAETPGTLHYQGRVAVAGEPFQGNGAFKFAIVDSGTEFVAPATATAALTGSIVTLVNVTNGGSGYPAPPKVTFSGGGGSGATATAVVVDGQVTTITVDSAGSGYTSPPAVSVSAPPPATIQSRWSHDGTSAAGSEPIGQVALPVGGGIFSVVLGANGMPPLESEVLAGGAMFLRVWFDGGNGFVQLAPDQPLTSVPFALRAAQAATVGSGAGSFRLIPTPAGGVILQTGGVTSMEITKPGTVGALTYGASIKAGYAGNLFETNPLGQMPLGATLSGGGAQNSINKIREHFATLSGGRGNTASGWASTVGGGEFNTASGSGTVVGGGSSNSTGGSRSTVGGGFSNHADGSQSTVGGGSFNEAIGSLSTVGGGDFNTAKLNWSTVGGGSSNMAEGGSSTVGGGWSNAAGGNWSMVGGGFSNAASGGSSTVGGGWSNAAVGEWSTVGGGVSNVAAGESSTVGGGSSNKASQIGSTVAGGLSNEAKNLWSTVGGGSDNIANNNHSTVGGGGSNNASGSSSTVGGGSSNSAIGSSSTVGGGSSNIASGLNSTVAGGTRNQASGSYSFAAGRRAKASHNGTFVWGDSTDADFTSVQVNQFLVRANGGVRFETGTRGLVAYGNNSGSVNAAIQAESVHAAGIALVGRNESSDATLVLNNRGTGPLIKAFKIGLELMQLTNSGDLQLRGVVTQFSDRDGKTGIDAVDPASVLAAVVELPISEWTYKHQSGERHVGPMAQDFHAAFGLGSGETSISVGDLGGIALAAIQGQQEIIDGQARQIGIQARKISEMEERLARLESLLASKAP